VPLSTPTEGGYELLNSGWGPGPERIDFQGDQAEITPRRLASDSGSGTSQRPATLGLSRSQATRMKACAKFEVRLTPRGQVSVRGCCYASEASGSIVVLLMTRRITIHIGDDEARVLEARARPRRLSLSAELRRAAARHIEAEARRLAEDGPRELPAALDFKVISQIIGHPSIVITQDRYTHVGRDHLVAAAALLSAHISRRRASLTR
jgi:hypothetical protein